MSGRFWGRWKVEIGSLCEQCSKKLFSQLKAKNLQELRKDARMHACLEMHVTVVRVPEVDIRKVKRDVGKNEGGFGVREVVPCIWRQTRSTRYG